VKREGLRWAAAWSAVVVALTCLPYMYAWWSEGPDLRFAGLLVNPLDGNSYLAKMRQGADGSWLFRLPYTAEEQEGAFIFTFYLGLGHLARLLDLPLPLIYHGARIACGFILLMAAAAFIARLLSDPQERRAAFWLVAVSSGVGWLGVLVGLFPIDLWVPEAITLYSILANPHFPLAMALMMTIFLGVYGRPGPVEGDGPSNRPAGRTRRALILPLVVTCLAGLALALIQPFALLTVGSVLLAYLAAQLAMHRLTAREAAAAVTMGVLVTPVIVYDYYVSQANPALAAWSAQNLTPSPPLWDLVMGYGLVLLLASLGAYRAWQRRTSGDLLLLSWTGATLLLLYVPFGLQRRLITGLHLPLAILAAVGLCRVILPRLAPAGRGRALVAAVAVTALSNVLVVLALLAGAASHDLRLYLTRDEVAGLTWLQENANANDVTLASPRTGMFIPVRGGGRVFYGHPFETIDAARKKALAEAFFAGQIQGTAWDELQKRYHITLVFYGPAERSLGTSTPGVLSTLVPAFHSGLVTVYRVPRGSLD
jgi:hypothetical protein